MPEYREVQHTISVPKNTGKDGFIHTISQILSLSHVQRIVIESQGQVTYRRMVLDGEEDRVVTADFDHINPYFIIRNSVVREYLYPNKCAAPAVLGGMLDEVSQDNLSPIAFVVGANTLLWSWYFFSTGLELSARDRLFGYTLYTDKQVPDTVLVLCAGLGRTSSLLNTRISLKVEIPRQRIPSGEEVEIL